MINITSGKLYKHLVYTGDGRPDSFHIFLNESSDNPDDDYKGHSLYAEDIFLCLGVKIDKDIMICKILTSAGIVGEIYCSKIYFNRFVLVNGGE